MVLLRKSIPQKTNLQTAAELGVITRKYGALKLNTIGRVALFTILIFTFGVIISLASLSTAFAFTPHNASKAYRIFIAVTQVPTLMACSVFSLWLSGAIAFGKSSESAGKLLLLSSGLYVLSWFLLILAAEFGIKI